MDKRKKLQTSLNSEMRGTEVRQSNEFSSHETSNEDNLIDSKSNEGEKKLFVE